MMMIIIIILNANESNIGSKTNIIALRATIVIKSENLNN